jgi:FtsP/CotA-like multicopper oxidase with cupredoxin domain
MNKRKFLIFIGLLLVVILFWGVDPGCAQMRRMTPAQREAAAARAAASPRSNLTVPTPGGTPNYFGPEPNYANSPLPAGAITRITVTNGGSDYTAPVVTITDRAGTGASHATATVVRGVITGISGGLGGSGYIAPQVVITGDSGTDATATAIIGGTLTGGIAKFVDSLPGLNSPNNLGQMIPIAVPDTITYPGSDYYEIAVREYSEQMHSQLPPTRLRGYVQLNNGTDSGGYNTVAPAPIHYLGPLIIAQKDRSVRIKFTNQLPTGAGGNLFLPVDTSIMGAGEGPLDASGNPCDPVTSTCANYTQNRATLHLHGGNTPWISDGTPHQWVTPEGEVTPYLKGVSQQNVPDMFFDPITHNPVPAGTPGATTDPGPGSETFYYTNQQSARLMFYHDHAYGITRLNVYAGMAAGYLLTDTVEQALVSSGVIPSTQIPLIIQDKTFVDSTQIAAEDPTWNWGTTAPTPHTGDLWYPHVYMTNQNPSDEGGANAMGRWDYGSWFWPPVTALAGLKNPPVTGDGTNGCPAGIPCPATPNPSLVPEAFMDTPVVNGTAYPYLTVERKAYRFRILNASNDRFLNLQLYYADPANPTEVKMVPAVLQKGFPATWPNDNRVGGVPTPRRAGPSMIQIGTEGGFLPSPVVLSNQPIDYDYNRRDIVVLNVSSHTLFLGPAERADVIIDFSKVPTGSKIILYNDSPAPVPGFDPRLDYYTGNPDLTTTGGTPATLPGYGPNTRTIMQFRVSGPKSPSFDLAALEAALPSAFAASQPSPIVPQTTYPAPFTAATDTYSRIADTSLIFTPVGSGTPTTMPMLPKAIHELFELDYGRMNSILGTELPLTNFNTQTTIPLKYIDPPTETIDNGETQIWKITHNGVDTHAIHFHLFNVQVINRVGWDGAVRPPDANELGWKETVRMNPLEDAIVALQPIVPRLPFSVPDSVRLLDVTMPEGSTGQFSNIDPFTNNPTVVNNDLTNFGWEYVWHCHLLGHEENDMMRPVTMTNVTNYVTPVAAPYGLTATVVGTQQVDFAWTDNSNNETGFRIERVIGAGAFATVGTVGANVTGYSDTTVQIGVTYSYRVFAFNIVGDSLPSNTATVTTSPLPAAPTNLTFVTSTPQSVTVSWTDNSFSEQGFQVQRSAAGANGPWSLIAKLPANTTTYTNKGMSRNVTRYYRVRAFNAVGNSGWSNVVSGSTLP